MTSDWLADNFGTWELLILKVKPDIHQVLMTLKSEIKGTSRSNQQHLYKSSYKLHTESKQTMTVHYAPGP